MNETFEYRVERRPNKVADWRAWGVNPRTDRGRTEAECGTARRLYPGSEFRVVKRTVTRTDWMPL